MFLCAAFEKLPAFPPQELATLVWALGRLRLIPPEAWVDAIWVESYEALPRMSPGQMSSVLWGAVRLGQAPPEEWMRRFLLLSGDSFGAAAGVLPAAAVAVLASAASITAQDFAAAPVDISPQPQRRQHNEGSDEGITDSMPAGSWTAQGLTNVVWSLASMEFEPGAEWLARFFATSQPALPAFTDVSCGRTLWALAKLGAAVPPAWLAAYLAVSQALLDADRFAPQHLSSMIWGLAVLRADVPRPWLHSFAAAVDRSMRNFKPVALARVLWALEVLDPETAKNWEGLEWTE